MDRLLKTDGWQRVAWQPVENMPGIDTIYRKVGQFGDDVYLIVEKKVSGVSGYFRGLLGRTRNYGEQFSFDWIDYHLKNLKPGGRLPSHYESLLKPDEVEYIIKNFDDSSRVVKRVIGGEILQDTLDDGGSAVLRLYDLRVDYPNISPSMKPSLVVESKDSLMVLTRQDVP